MSVFYMVLAALIVLGPLIAIHEFGHFWVARRLGVKVMTFSIGFGPALLKWQDGKGTRYQIAAIPLGGFVRMADEREGEVPPEDLPRAFNRQPVLARMAIVAAGPLINLVFAVFLYWIIFMQGTETLRPIMAGCCRRRRPRLQESRRAMRSSPSTASQSATGRRSITP